jgi:ABC-type transport system substrate-binding protein
VDLFLNWPYNAAVPPTLGARDITVNSITGVIINMDRVKGHPYLRDDSDLLKREKNLKVREALDMLIPRDFILFQLLNRDPKPDDYEKYLLYGPWPHHEFLGAQVPAIVGGNSKGADDLIRKTCGWSKDGQGYWLDAQSKRITLRFIHGDFGRDTDRQICDEICKRLESNGFYIEKSATTTNQFLARLQQGDFDLAFKTYTLSGTHRENLGYLFVDQADYNPGRFNNAEVRRLFEKAGQSRDPGEQREFLKDAAYVIGQQRPWLFLYDLPFKAVYRPNFLRLPSKDSALSADDFFINACDWSTGG